MIVSSILSEDSNELLSALERQSTVILQQNSSLGSNLADIVTVVVLNINVVVELFITLLSNVVTVSEGAGSPGGKVGSVLDLVVFSVDKVPGSDDTDSHVIDSVLRNGSVQYGDCEVGSPEGGTAVEADVTRHGHIEASKGTRYTRVLSTAVVESC